MTIKKSYSNSLETAFAVQSAEIAMQSMKASNSLIKTFEGMDAMNSIHKSLEAMTESSLFANMMASIEAKSSMHMAMESMAESSLFANMVASAEARRSFHKSMDSIAQASFIAKKVNTMDFKRSMQKAVQAVATSSSLVKVLETMDATSNMQKYLDSMVASSSLAKLMGTLEANNHFHQAMQSLAEPKYFRAAISAVDTQVDLCEITAEDELISGQLEKVENAKDTESFLKAFANLSPLVQTFMLFLILNIVTPIVNGITANVITPYIESLISSSDKPKREIVKGISTIHIDGLNLEQHRFVSVENLHLRKESSTKSAILDNLRLGQVLTVISRRRNWLEVSYSYSDGELMQGWVFARYTAKFRE